ncbi:MAG: hypothetical protein KGL53_00330, partial [Elusimicrobia bacterium]|nr:hypothetical protein [Elusimicrobiota bacterium]
RERLVGAVAVDRVRYVLSGAGLEPRETLALLDTLSRQDVQPASPPAPAPAAAAPPAEEPSLAEAPFFGGAVRLARPQGGGLLPQRDGWVMASAPGWSLGLSDAAGPDAGSESKDARATVARRARELSRTRGCRGGDPVEQPLKNGWDALLVSFACPAARPGGVIVAGAALRPGGSPLWLAGEYGTIDGLDAMLAWLGTGADEARAAPAVPSEEPPGRRAPLTRPQALAGLVGGCLGLLALGWRAVRRKGQGTA